MHRDLLSFETVLDHDALSGVAEPAILERGLRRGQRLLARRRDDDALARGEAVALHDQRSIGIAREFREFVDPLERPPRCRWYAGLLHHFLGEDL